MNDLDAVKDLVSHASLKVGFATSEGNEDELLERCRTLPSLACFSDHHPNSAPTQAAHLRSKFPCDSLASVFLTICPQPVHCQVRCRCARRWTDAPRDTHARSSSCRSKPNSVQLLSPDERPEGAALNAKPERQACEMLQPSSSAETKRGCRRPCRVHGSTERECCWSVLRHRACHCCRAPHREVCSAVLAGYCRAF